MWVIRWTLPIRRCGITRHPLMDNQTPIINAFIYKVHFEQQLAIESAADGTFLDDIVAVILI